MSETPESVPTLAPVAPAAAPKPYWLYRLAAWVGVIAGIVFIVGSIFVAGLYAGGGFDHQHCRHHHSMHHRMGDHPMNHHHHHPDGPPPMGPMAPPPGQPPSSAPSTPPPPPPGPTPTR